MNKWRGWRPGTDNLDPRVIYSIPQAIKSEIQSSVNETKYESEIAGVSLDLLMMFFISRAQVLPWIKCA